MQWMTRARTSETGGRLLLCCAVLWVALNDIFAMMFPLLPHLLPSSPNLQHPVVLEANAQEQVALITPLQHQPMLSLVGSLATGLMSLKEDNELAERENTRKAISFSKASTCYQLEEGDCMPTFQRASQRTQHF